MFVKRVCFLLTFLINYAYSTFPYTIPEPKIEIFKKGFRLSIPDEEGVDLFAFHGNINVPMHGIEAGEMSRDIVKKCGDLWVFEDKSVKLRVGDSIYFWLFVIRNKLGYRYDDGVYNVKEITELRPLQCDLTPKRKNNTDIWSYDPEPTFRPLPTVTPPPKEEGKDEEKQQLSVCCDLFLNVSYRLVALAEQNTKLMAENNLLFELAEKEHLSKTLRIIGKYPSKFYPIPGDFAQKLIEDKLLLDNVKIREVRTISDSEISFEVEKLSDKVKIILAAKKGLEGSNYKLSW